MTTQQVESGKQEHWNSSYGTLHTTQLVVGRLALRKGEGEGEGLLRTTHCGDSKLLTSVLSPRSREEAEEISVSEN
jgi:hypothetical protein